MLLLYYIIFIYLFYFYFYFFLFFIFIYFFRSEVGAETIAETLNQFVKPLEVKTVVCLMLMLIINNRINNLIIFFLNINIRLL